MNNVQIYGRMTADVDLKVNTNGTEYCNFTIAVDRYMGKDKERQTDFINCKAFSKTASLLKTYFPKGRGILIDGSLHFDRYDKDGETRTYAYVTVEKVHFTAGKSGDSGKNYAQPTSASDNELPDFVPTSSEDEDLPF